MWLPDEYHKIQFLKGSISYIKASFIRGESSCRETQQAVSQISVTVVESHAVALAPRMLQAHFWGTTPPLCRELGGAVKEEMRGKG